ncbi:2-hydroxychromene-2-carboxylate isomerase [Hoeflea prorocentri]|uniref:2-hydroxychromene-2-carboxylate isomerase n=1 Tax=Hoeflea prorocentri TaxID=1922333 RepID=A0A9X3UJI5_9HYPH|nr:2-hydroxychromene-2-carboxylate isomerase [Hoeflea prorocentri]MCY6382517.1 2-hydroxychromene-2-carboxylate isomerase [Hoeflea prorocentri]MDA5400317.1 2-hydroxychromene-2-carboxylate isomerase [Hoeflea prorocentri]
MAVVDYYFYGASPFTYLGHGALMRAAERQGAEIVFKPVNLMTIWAVSGAVPPAQRPPVRQRYRLVELQRIAEYRGLPINTKPKFWPTDTSLADQAVIALVEAGENPADYMQKVFAGVWADERELSDRAVVASMLSDCGFDADAILERAASDDIAAIRDRNSEDAVAADAVGVPAYVLNGEVFWGQDRIDLLEHALKTGRAPYTP